MTAFHQLKLAGVRTVQPASVQASGMPPIVPGTTQPSVYVETCAVAAASLPANASAAAVGALPSRLTSVSVGMLANACAPIVATSAASVTAPVSPVAPLNAFAPIVVTPAGIVSDPVRPVSPANAPAPMAVTAQPAAHTVPATVALVGSVQSCATTLLGPVSVIVSGRVPLADHATPLTGSVPVVGFGVTADEALDGAESVEPLFAFAVNAYDAPFTRPLIVQRSAVALMAHVVVGSPLTAICTE